MCIHAYLPPMLSEIMRPPDPSKPNDDENRHVIGSLNRPKPPFSKKKKNPPDTAKCTDMPPILNFITQCLENHFARRNAEHIHQIPSLSRNYTRKLCTEIGKEKNILGRKYWNQNNFIVG